MTKTLPEISTNSLDDLFSTEQERQDAKKEKIIQIPIHEIHDFKGHPFQVRMDENMVQLIESIKDNGVLVPVLVRPRKEGGYEMVSGHRRKFAIEQNGKETIDAIVRNLSDDEATIIMVDSNIQRENILPTERGFAYRMKLEAMKHQGKRSDLTSMQVAQKLKKGKWAVDELSQEVGISKDNIRRFIRLTYLNEPLRELVDGVREDGKKMALNPAVELSYLSLENQDYLVSILEDLDVLPSHAQTIRMKKLSNENHLDENVIYSILSEEKGNQKEKLSFKMEDINVYFPMSYTPRQKSEVILRLLESWSKKRQKEQER